MAHSSQISWQSDDSARSTTGSVNSSSHLYKAVVADINFQSSPGSTTVNISKNSTVHDLLNNGPDSISGTSRLQARWIHLPANNMAWIEALMARLHEEQTDHNTKVDEQNRETTRFDSILRDDVWRLAFHGRGWNGSIHSRFMRPFAIRYSSTDPDGPDSDESESTWTKANIVSLHIPYFHWESYNSWKARQKHIATMKGAHFRGESCGCLENRSGQITMHDKEKALLHEYLFHDSAPVHDRRTLDQSYFYNLRNVAHHDQDQIIGLHTWNRSDQQDEGRKMMMTDQLWMWIVDDNTVITAFPQTGVGILNEADVLHHLLEDLQRLIEQSTIRSANGLAGLIIDYCTGVFHRSDIRDDLAFFEFFADEIGTAKSEVTRMFHEFRKISESVEKYWTDSRTTEWQMTRLLDNMYSIKNEIRQIERIEKIISDLDKIDYLCSQQEDVVKDLLKCLKHGRTHSRSIIELQETVEKRRSDWAGMAETAKATHKDLHSLLDLKQRQAAVSEARTVRYQVELSAKQGHSIMLLTVFTIFFLPLSVMATIFGMNAKELVSGGGVSLRVISYIVAPANLALFALALVIAFNHEANRIAKVVLRGSFATLMGTAKSFGQHRANITSRETP